MANLASYEECDLSTIVTQAVKSITCGIAPHAGKLESEEYRSVPIWLRNRNGLPADEVAHLLSIQHPELGIETENDLLDALSEGKTQRQNAQAAPATMQQGFDPLMARKAVEDFAWSLENISPTAVEQIRQAWLSAYKLCGHKALARYLVSGDINKACKNLDKLAVN